MTDVDLMTNLNELRPFLLRFAVTRRAPDVAEPVLTRYDDGLAMTVLDTPDGTVAVICLPGYAGTRTKKADIEKGEDVKDQPRPSPRPPAPKPAPRPRP